MTINPKDKVWTEKYRPHKVSDMVGDFKDKISKHLQNFNSMQHLLLYSKTPGTGKCLTKDHYFFTKNGMTSFEDYCKKNNIIDEHTDKIDEIYDVENNY